MDSLGFFVIKEERPKMKEIKVDAEGNLADLEGRVVEAQFISAEIVEYYPSLGLREGLTVTSKADAYVIGTNGSKPCYNTLNKYQAAVAFFKLTDSSKHPGEEQ